MENTHITISKFDASNIVDYASSINYSNIVCAVDSIITAHNKESKVDTEDLLHLTSSVLTLMNSIECLKDNITEAFKDQDLSPFC